jgi:RNA polymerase sigma factor (sigma-70 family)
MESLNRLFKNLLPGKASVAARGRHKQTVALVSLVGVNVGAVSTRERLEELYRQRYFDFVRVATAIVGSETAGIDVLQESFARALTNTAAFREEGPLEGWLWRIVVNTARTSVRHPEVSTSQLEATSNGTDAHERPAALAWALAQLTERQRLVVFLRYYADLDYRSIAGTLAIEVGTVSATLSAAHNKLRRLIEEVPS